MPTRREFLSSATVTLLLIPLAHCGSSTVRSGTPVATGGTPGDGGTDGATGADSGADATASDVADAGGGFDAGDVGDGASADSGACAIESTSSQTADPVMGNALHTHTICVPASDLANPPDAGVTYTTSSSLSHTHQVLLAQVDLIAVASGGTATAVSTTADQHSHKFVIVPMM